MFYLVHCDTHECVNFQAIIEITDSKKKLIYFCIRYR